MSSGEDIKSLQQKLREMEKNQDDLQNKVAKKERDCEIKEQEKVGIYSFPKIFTILM